MIGLELKIGLHFPVASVTAKETAADDKSLEAQSFRSEADALLKRKRLRQICPYLEFTLFIFRKAAIFVQSICTCDIPLNAHSVVEGRGATSHRLAANIG